MIDQVKRSPGELHRESERSQTNKNDQYNQKGWSSRDDPQDDIRMGSRECCSKNSS